MKSKILNEWGIVHDSEAQRDTYRVKPDNSYLHIFGVRGQFQVFDLSSGGVSFLFPIGQGHLFDIDTSISINIFAHETWVKDLGAVILRVADRKCSCTFERVSRPQQQALDLLILNMQKDLIIKRRKLRSPELADPVTKTGKKIESTSFKIDFDL